MGGEWGRVERGREDSGEGGKGCPFRPEKLLINVSSSPLHLALLGAGGASSSLAADFSEQRRDCHLLCSQSSDQVPWSDQECGVTSCCPLTSLWSSRQRERLERGLHRVIERARIAPWGCAGVESQKLRFVSSFCFH